MHQANIEIVSVEQAPYALDRLKSAKLLIERLAETRPSLVTYDQRDAQVQEASARQRSQPDP